MGTIELDSHKPFAGRYKVLRRIAAGGMGAVYEVEHVETQRRRALKVMLPELVSNRELRDRFQMEARVTARVDSEYIVDVFDAGVDETTAMPFLVMELLQGEDLGEFLSRVGAVPSRQVVVYLRQVASALDKTHQAGIVHRDLKPENLFLTHREDGTPRIKILDFGISKVINEATTVTNVTRSLGTPLYMAPEQVLGQSVSTATDLYSLALIAYTLLVGVSYWQPDANRFDNAIAFVLHTTRGTTESAVARAAGAGRILAPEFDAWFRRATHLEPAHRFQRATELVNALAALLGFAAEATAPAAPMAEERQGPHASSRVQAVSEPLAGGTAPGTEFNRPATIPGVSAGGGRVWLIAAAIGMLLMSVGGAALWMRRPTLAATSAAGPPAHAPALAPTGTAAGETAPVSSPSPSATAEKSSGALPSSSRTRSSAPSLALAPAQLVPLAGKPTAKTRAPLATKSEAGASSVRRAPEPTQQPIYTRD